MTYGKKNLEASWSVCSSPVPTATLPASREHSGERVAGLEASLLLQATLPLWLCTPGPSAPRLWSFQLCRWKARVPLLADGEIVELR